MTDFLKNFNNFNHQVKDIDSIHKYNFNEYTFIPNNLFIYRIYNEEDKYSLQLAAHKFNNNLNIYLYMENLFENNEDDNGESKFLYLKYKKKYLKLKNIINIK